MRDAIGQTIDVGDHVAHVTRHGSRVSITERLVIELRPGSDQVLLEPLSRFNSPPVQAYNVVVVRP